MKYKKYKLERREKRKVKGKLLKFLFFSGIAGITVYMFFSLITGKPQVENLRDITFIPAQKDAILRLKGDVKRATIKILQGEREFILYDAPPQGKAIPLHLAPRQMGLTDGKAKLLITLRYGLLGRKTYQMDTWIDTLPPKLEVVGYTRYVPQGGTGAVKARVKDGYSAYLQVGEERYPMYPVGKEEYFTLYPVKVDQDPSTTIKVVAYDLAGNSTTALLKIQIKKVQFKTDRIKLSEEFIKKVIIPLLGRDMPPIDAFKEVNENWRKKDVENLKRIGSNSTAKKLWEGNFLQLPGSKVISTFGDIRYYYYQDREISMSRHMGYDFASVENAPVPASNSGIVVFTGNMGIYGNMVVIDHGFGLMSLYGHLSEIKVKKRQFVKKGDIIANTDSTGLALGDHLHFGIMVHGIEVNPKEWLDAKWLKTNIDSVLEAN
ncbi:M23 family metallopeptidase [Hydrogenobacter hydrogenophilus]|uniref:Peptidase family M23 n=1 Tax=Hydrogenobacter hydrogenophilus TaxID=35835 RepID=A0A285NPJ3_9AQUI|nr:M23 family metallopeptidase [Hydrogenobacter hydrogenophilus]SNZ11385.1 Peptidase family M23 [Hydrogenobacter hydrogenophilus]